MQFTRFFIPPLNPGLPQSTIDLRWVRFREQILTGLLRIITILSIPTALISIALAHELNLTWLSSLYISCITFVWWMAIRRSLHYQVRVIVLLSSVYLLGVSEIFNFGYTENAYGCFVAFSVFSLILINRRVGLLALLISTGTLLLFGFAFVQERLIPHVSMRVLNQDIVLITSIAFFLITGGIQVSIAMLFRGIESAWLEAQQAREELEQRVAERTQELALAHQEALKLSQERNEQSQFLAALNQIAIDLFQNQDRETLPQSIMQRAAALFDSPYGQLILVQGDAFVVQATTVNLAPLQGSYVSREEAHMVWQAIDSAKPVVAHAYQSWPQNTQPEEIAQPAQPMVIASFPILIDQRCLGVLVLGRNGHDQGFDDEAIQKALLFTQLIAVVLQNQELYTTALHEIRIRREAEEQLHQQNSELDAFAHTVAHDLKNPLFVMVANTQLLQISYSDMAPAEIDAQLKTILNAGMKMNTIIESLLMLSSVQLQQYIQRTALDMRAIVQAALYHLQHQIQQSQATIHLPETWPNAHGYAPWIEEVWINYLSNAFKYGGNPPIITIEVEQIGGNSVRFWVQDNGPGIPAEQQDQLFTPFTRLRPAKIQGHGLGLSIVQRIVSKLGGQVGVESQPNQGSRFFFTLPLGPSATE